MRRLAQFRIDYYVENPLMVALIASENLQKAQYLNNPKEIQVRDPSSPAQLARTRELACEVVLRFLAVP